MLSKRQWIIQIATTLRKSYGNTLVESGTDLMMAIDVVRGIKDHIIFNKTETINKEAFLNWRIKFLKDANISSQEAIKQAQEDWDKIKSIRFKK